MSVYKLSNCCTMAPLQPSVLHSHSTPLHSTLFIYSWPVVSCYLQFYINVKHFIQHSAFLLVDLLHLRNRSTCRMCLDPGLCALITTRVRLWLKHCWRWHASHFFFLFLIMLLPAECAMTEKLIWVSFRREMNILTPQLTLFYIR